MQSLLRTRADCTGLPMPRLRLPRELVLAAGAVSGLGCL